MSTIESVSLDIVTDEQWIRGAGGGGIKISLDGHRLNRFVDEDRDEWIEDWYPKYVGSVITSDLWNLVSITSRMMEQPSLYEAEVFDFTELRSRLLLEPVGDETIRIAFRVAPTQSGEYTIRPVPESACGYPVDMFEWGDAVHDAGRALRDELVKLGHKEPGGDFDQLLEGLEEFL